MKQLCAYRDSHNQYEASFTKICKNGMISVLETSMMVDGIGGVIWDGSFLMCHLLESFNIKDIRVFELGCGSGLCGILAALLGADVIMSDQCTDLADVNTQAVQVSMTSPLRVRTVAMDWRSWQNEMTSDFGDIDLIIGSEICCLKNVHDALVSTLDALTGPKTVVLLTFDGAPPPIGSQSQYETLFLEKVRALGFAMQLALVGRVQWTRHTPLDIDLVSIFPDGLPAPLPDTTRSYATLELWPDENSVSVTTTGAAAGTDSNADTSLEYQHVWGFFRRSAGNTCSRCHCHFLHVLNSPKACRHHHGLFVCRRHPGETRMAIGGAMGDGLGYYGNGREEGGVNLLSGPSHHIKVVNRHAAVSG
eukprot:gene7793-15939_t